MARLTAEFWVSAYLNRLRTSNIPAFVVSRGDATAGTIVIKINTLDGEAEAFQRSFDANGNRVWMTLVKGADEAVEQSLQKQRQFDPDIWIIEVEDKAGRHLLDDPSLGD